MGFLGKIRRWVDGEEGEDSLEKASEQAKPRGAAQDFIVKLAREVEAVMRNEMVPLPQGTVIIPTEYIIFLSEEDDREWQGAKRRGLEQGLHHVLAERAREMAGKNKLQVQSFSVEMRVDGTLQKGEIRVQHSWDEANSGKTSVTPRRGGSSPKIQLPPTPVQQTPVQPQRPPIVQPNLSPPPPIQQVQQTPANLSNQMQPTQLVQLPTDSPILAQPQIVEEENEAATIVKKRGATELFKLEVWRNNQRQTILPVFKTEISIGRGSQSFPVDIPLKGDNEISRRHVTLSRDEQGTYWIAAEGKNPVIIGSVEIPAGQKTAVAAGTAFTVCSYTLIIKQ